MKKKAMPYAAILTLGFICAGSSVISSKLLAGYWPPFFLCFVSLSMALFILIPFGKSSFRRWILLSLKEKGLIALQALSGIVFFRVFLLMGLERGSAWQAGLILSFSPLVFGILAAIILRERWGKKGILCAVGAVLALILVQSGEDSGFSLTALPFFILALISEALMTILRKKSNPDTDPLHHAIWVLASAWGLTLIPAILEIPDLSFQIHSPAIIFALLHYGIIASGAAYYCWSWGSRGVKGSTAGLISMAIPVTSLILSRVVLKEEIDIRQLGGIVLALMIMLIYFLPLRKSTEQLAEEI